MARVIRSLFVVVLLGFLAAKHAPAEPDEQDLLGELVSADEVRTLFQKEMWSAFQQRMAKVDEAHLETLLDQCIAPESKASHRVSRAVSHALGWKILDRRVAPLRSRAPTQASLASAPKLDVLSYPATDGSTSTIPLERLIACRVLGSPYVWGAPVRYREHRAPFVRPGSGGIPFASKPYRPGLLQRMARGGILAYDEGRRGERLASIVNHLLVKHAGTHGAWVNLIEGKADLVFVARAPSEEEWALAAERGIELDAVPVARDGFVFLVHRSNPVEGLTLDQVRAIYRGTTKQWDAVGGTATKIRALQRNPNSGSQELFLSLVMQGEKPAVARGDSIRGSMIGPFNAIATQTDALGFTVWYYDRYMALIPEVKTLAIDGVQPEPENLASGTYPLVTRVYAAVRADAPADGAARRLRDWLLTPTGQAVVAESGYLPLAGD